MEAVKPKTKAKKKVAAAKLHDPKPEQETQEQNVAQEKEDPKQIPNPQIIEPQQPDKSPSIQEQNKEPAEDYGKVFDDLLTNKDKEKIYPQLSEDEVKSDTNQEKVKERMDQYAEATKEKLGMIEKFFENIDEKAAIAKEREKEINNEEEREGDEDGMGQSYFYHLVNTFRQAQIERSNSFPNYEEESKISATDPVPLVWKIENSVNKRTCHCNDCGKPKNFKVDCSVANFNGEACEEFAKSLNKFREMQRSTAVLLNKHNVAKYRIERHISEYVLSTSNFGKLRADAPVIAVAGCQQTPELIHEMAYMRHMLSVLFHFERNKPAALRELTSLSKHELEKELSRRGNLKKKLFYFMSEFYTNVEIWIKSIGACVLRLASFDDHRFLLQQLLACPGCSSWGGSALVQFPIVEVWNEVVANHFKDVLFAVLRPVPKRKSGNENSKLEWGYSLEENPGEFDEDDLRGFEALETDLIALFEQIPIGPFCNFLLENEKFYDTFRHNIFDMLKLFCEAIKNMKEYNDFAKRIVEIITIFLTVVAKRNEDLVTATSGTLVTPPRPELEAMAIEHQKQFNTYFVSVVYSIRLLGNPSLWQFLSGLPFGALDEQGAWQTLGLLHGIDIAQLPQSHDDWKALNTEKDGDKSTTPYESLVHICKEDNVKGIYLINALGSLGRSPRATNAIELICLDTLYEAGFIDRRIRSKFFKTIVGEIGGITERHPDIITYLLDRIDDSLCNGMHASVADKLFSHISFDIWVPSINAIWNMGKWASYAKQQVQGGKAGGSNDVKENTSALLEKVEPGRRFFERIDWGNPRMSIDANICAALAILGVWKDSNDKYMTSSVFDKSARDKYSRDVNWCWSQLLRLRYARPGEERTLCLSYKSDLDKSMDYEMRSLWSFAETHATGVADGTILPKNVEAIPLFVGIALRTPENIVESLMGINTEQEVVKLLSVLVDKDTKDTPTAIGAAFLLSQFVSLAIKASAGSDKYLDVQTPAFIALMEKIVCSNSNGTLETFANLLNPLTWGGKGWSFNVKDMASLLVMDQIEQECKDIDFVTKYAEFWILAATKGNGWVNNSARTGIVESVLSSWICFVDRAVPAPFVHSLLERAAQGAGDKKDGLASLLPQDPVTRIIGIVWSDFLKNAPFMTFQILLAEAIRNFKQGKALDINSFRQIFNYGVNLDTTSEANVLYWDVIVYMYFSLLFEGSNKRALCDVAPRLIERLYKLEESFRSQRSSERNIVGFFRNAARAIKISMKDEYMTKQSLLATIQLQQQNPEKEKDGKEDDKIEYDALLVQCITQSPIASPERLFVQCIDADNVLGKVPRFSRARTPVQSAADQECYYDNQLARKTAFEAVIPPQLPKYSRLHAGSKISFNDCDYDVKNRGGLIAKTEEALHNIAKSAEEEYNRINKLFDLDKKYIELLAHCYTNESRCIMLCEQCLTCKSNIKTELIQDRALKNDEAIECMNSNRKLAYNYSQATTEDKTHCACIAYLERLIMILGKASANEATTTASQDNDGEVLALCKVIWTKLVDAYNTHHVLWWMQDVFAELIRSITSIIVRDSNKNAWVLLASALGDSSVNGTKLPVPQKTFCPWYNRMSFHKMLERTLDELIFGSSEDSRNRAEEILHACFRVDMWLAEHSTCVAIPPEELRKVLNTLLLSIKACLNDVKRKNDLKFVTEHCEYVFRSVESILKFAFPEFIENVIEEFFNALSLKDATPSSSASAITAAAGSFWTMLSKKLPLERISIGKAQGIIDTIAKCLFRMQTSYGSYGVLACAIFAPHVVSFVNELMKKAVYPTLNTSEDNIPIVARLADSYLAMVKPIATYKEDVVDTDIAKSAAQAVFVDGLGDVFGNHLCAIMPNIIANRMWTVLTETAPVLTYEALVDGRVPIWFQDFALNSFCKASSWDSWLPTFEQVDYLYKLLLAAASPQKPSSPLRCSVHFPRLLLSICLRVDWCRQPYFRSVEPYSLVLNLVVLSLRLTPAETLESDGVEEAIAKFHERIRRVSINAVPQLNGIYNSIYENALKQYREYPDPEGQLRWRLIFHFISGIRVDADETTNERMFERLKAFAVFYARAQTVSPELYFDTFVPIILAEHLSIWKNMGFMSSPDAESVVISLFDLYNADGLRSSAFHKAVLEYLANGKVEEAPYFVKYACSTIKSAQQMPGFVEGFLDIYLTKYGNWEKITRALTPPADRQHEFFDAAVETGSILTLFAAAMKVKKADPAEFASKVPQWTSRVKIGPGAEHRYLLLVNEVIKGVVADPRATNARSTLEEVVKKLSELSVDRNYGNGAAWMLNVIFKNGEVSQYSTKFRFAAKVLSAFISAQFMDGEGAGVRILDLDPRVAKGDKMFNDMKYVETDKKYLEDIGEEVIKSILMYLEQTVHNNNYTFTLSYSDLMKKLVEGLFSDKKEMTIIIES